MVTPVGLIFDGSNCHLSLTVAIPRISYSQNKCEGSLDKYDVLIDAHYFNAKSIFFCLKDSFMCHMIEIFV